MKYYRLNQIAMAVLGALLLFFGTKTIINIANEEPEAEKPGMEVAGKPETKPAGEAAAPAAPAAGGGSEVVALMATADPKAGEADAGLCKVCHTLDKGGAVVVGPNLYGVVGRKIASVPGFNYTGLKGKDGVWDYATLDVWLTNPQAFAPGTAMAFPGFPEAKKRADVIAFLREHADTPAPLPEAGAGGAAPAPAEAPKSEAPAEAPKAEAPAADTAPTAGEGQSAPAENSAPAAPPQ